MAFRAIILVLSVTLVISSAYGQRTGKAKPKAKVVMQQMTVREYEVFTVSCPYPQQVVIASASYGMDERKADVTSQINDFCEAASFCRLKVTNNHPIDQDPYPNMVKELKVKYYCYGALERNPHQARPSGIAVQEYQWFEDPCKAVGMPLQIGDAYYGYKDKNADVTSQMKQYCLNSCNFEVSNNAQPIQQDPVHGHLKVLQVSFQCGGDEDAE